MGATALLESNPDLTREEIKEQLSENLCRCMEYKSIVGAVEKAAESYLLDG